MKQRQSVPLLLCAAAVAALGGCASYSERQAQDPWFHLVTPKSPEVFTGCAAPLIRDLWPGITTGPEGTATVLAFPIPNSRTVLATVTITPAAIGGSDVSLRSATKTGDYRKVAAMLDSCR